MKNRGRLAAFAVTVVAIIGGSAAVSWAVAPPPPEPAVSTVVLPECSTEDDPRDCYWDANRRGNSTGTSFIHYRNNYYMLDD